VSTLRHVVIEGPIGVGKTTLARRLAEALDAELLLEQPQDNPFLARYYQDPRHAALPAQLFFLFQRVQQMQGLSQPGLFHTARVCDYLFEKDRLFAELTLDPEEFDLYRKISQRLPVAPPAPDLVVYLQAPAEVLLRRIAQRGIAYEQSITAAYLRRIMDAYTRLFHSYTAAPLLIVNATQMDPVHNEDHFQLLLTHMRQAGPGRHYFNPGPLA
jgi:deoxyadenosine/deoxycytidine kinase